MQRVGSAIGKLVVSKTHLIVTTHREDEITDCFANVFEIRDRQLVERDQAA
jgi:ABC-type molybdenum transport system ATPase subunit/photorepair protein PhrA